MQDTRIAVTANDMRRLEAFHRDKQAYLSKLRKMEEEAAEEALRQQARFQSQLAALQARQQQQQEQQQPQEQPEEQGAPQALAAVTPWFAKQGHVPMDTEPGEEGGGELEVEEEEDLLT